ncbi:MAG: NAD(P)H-dependent oxidoreductase [Candidatus Eremiobacteraeota bacterium]|nr:NAD(P)H-dependent oxidoreductase [Candidatus Eremiobacteraeota bacterium]
MIEPVTIAAFAGSLRAASYNRRLLAAAVSLAPPDVRIETIDIAQIPLYSEDLDAPTPPAAVATLRETIARCAALLVVTPEYNFSMSGVTKNVIDWASRPPDDSCLEGKPLGIMGASQGGFGTVRAQIHLRDSAVFNNMFPLNDPLVHVSRAQDKFDDAGRLIDERVKSQVVALLEALAAWTRRLGSK